MRSGLALLAFVPGCARELVLSCPEGAVAVPAGSFVMGDDAGDRDARPAHEVFVSAFCLDKLEASAGQIDEWRRSAGRGPERDDGAAMRGALEADPQLPATDLSWQEAADYCAGRGGRLPTEAEWEKAARGGCEIGGDSDTCDASDRRVYPWGDEAPDCAITGHLELSPTGPRPCGLGPAQVGFYPANASPYGLPDMAGGAWEWVSDWYDPGVYGGERRDPAGPPTGPAHVLRGGAWNTLAVNQRVSNRMSGLIDGSASGVRCAYGGTTPTLDAASQTAWVELSGEISRADGQALSGRALYITAFAEEDVQNGLPRPGASPVAERRLHPDGQRQPFTLHVPDGRYVLMAALDDRPPDPGAGAWSPPASSGGAGIVGPVVSGETATILLSPVGEAGVGP